MVDNAKETPLDAPTIKIYICKIHGEMKTFIVCLVFGFVVLISPKNVMNSFVLCGLIRFHTHNKVPVLG